MIPHAIFGNERQNLLPLFEAQNSLFSEFKFKFFFLKIEASNTRMIVNYDELTPSLAQSGQVGAVNEIFRVDFVITGHRVIIGFIQVKKLDRCSID